MASYKVLIVDDEADIIEISKDVFDSEGHQAVVATCAVDALEILAKDPAFDIIISDSNMPNLTGVEFFYKVKEMFAGDHPNFFLSTGDFSLKRDELIAQGMSGVILKPYDVDNLVDYIIKNHTRLEAA